MLAFTVYGVAVPKGNMRAINIKGMKFPIVTETNRNVRSWSQLVAQGASDALQKLPAADRGVLTGAVRLTIAVFLPRPKALMEELVALFTNPGDQVVDPFMGAGTTLVACKRLGREAIGIELEERYCEIAAKRLSQGTLSGLFLREARGSSPVESAVNLLTEGS